MSTTKEFDAFFDAVSIVSSVANFLKWKSEAFRCLHQHDIADEFEEREALLKKAVKDLNAGFSAELNNHANSHQIHATAMITTLLNLAEKSGEEPRSGDTSKATSA